MSMAKLVLSLDGLVIREFPLERARFRIGRKPGNDLQIDNLAVSGEHAVLFQEEGRFFVEDLGSTNGTRVNGLPVAKQPLQDADLIEIGRYRLTYRTGGPAYGLPPAVLQVLDGNSAGRTLELNKAETSIGRAGQQVAVITRRPDGYFITHRAGEVPPQLNGLPLTAEAGPLADRDLIQIAGVRMEFSFRQAV